jgi:hypothetical protein
VDDSEIEWNVTDWTDRSGRVWTVRLGWAGLPDRLQCVAMDLRPAADEPEPLTATLLRDLPLGRLIEGSRRVMTAQLAIAGSDLETLKKLAAARMTNPLVRRMIDAAIESSEAARQRARDGVEAIVGAIEQPKGRRPLYDDEHFKKVADVYLASWRSGSPNPTKDVADHESFRVTRSTAAKWVARARSLGYLAETTQGRPSGPPVTEGDSSA